jgi:hypothetical protein
MDPVRLEIDAEPVHQHEPRDRGPVASGEHARIHLAQGVTDDDVRWSLTRRLQQRDEIVRGVGDAMASPRVTTATARSIVGTRPGAGRDGIDDGRPAGDSVAHPRLEHDGRRPFPAAVDVQRPPSDIDAFTIAGDAFDER